MRYQVKNLEDSFISSLTVRSALSMTLLLRTPDTPVKERRKIRGVIVEVKDLVEAKRKFRRLEAAAEEAVYANEVPQFLDELGRRHRPSVDRGPKFEEFIREWEQICVEGGGLRESTIESDKSIIANHLVPFFGRYGLKMIDARLVDKYKTAKRKEKHQFGRGYSAKSINKQLSVRHRVFEKAIEYEMLIRNPISQRTWLKPESTPENSENWLSPDEEQAAIGKLEEWRETNPDKRLVILTQLITGMRFGEIRALEKRDSDLNVPGLWVRRSMARRELTTPKNKKARFQVIPQGLAQELREHMLKTEGQLLFPGPKGGPLPNNALNRWYKKLAAEADIRPISSHGARHTSGSSYAVMGVGQNMIAQLLGHADTGTTERYTHVQVEATQPLVEARWARLVGRE